MPSYSTFYAFHIPYILFDNFISISRLSVLLERLKHNQLYWSTHGSKLNQAMDQVIPTSPTSLFSPNASHTASDPSTMLLRHGLCPACSASQPCLESHSSTTFAFTLRPLLALIRIIWLHRLPPLYHPVERATIGFALEWYLPSHSDGPPPSPPWLKSLFVRVAGVGDVMGGEHSYVGYVLPLQVREPDGLQAPPGWGEGVVVPWHMWVPKSGSSVHFRLMQMSLPLQSFRSWHGPLQSEIEATWGGRNTSFNNR